MRNTGKALLPLMAAVLLLLSGNRVMAAQPVDPGRTGSVTICLSWNGRPLQGGTVLLYRVAGLGEAMEYVPEPEFEACGADMNRPADAQTAALLAQYARENGLSAREQDLDTSGTAAFSGLETGLYLLTQGRACSGFLPFRPFLIGIPQQIGDTLVYDVDAGPKAEPKPANPLPQTGQRNLPAALLTVAGLGLVGLGICIRGRERHGP